MSKLTALTTLPSIGKFLMLVAIFAGISASQAIAGIEIRESGVEIAMPSTIIIEPAPGAPNQRRLPGQTLRCWNHGRLVYEAGGFRASPDRPATAVAIPRAADGYPVTVFDMKEGMCILSTH